MKLQERITKKSLERVEDLETIIDSTVLDPDRGDSSVSGRIRRFYTNNYKSLDQFDQLWYECAYDKREKYWETTYAWAVILDCFINARSAYCEATSKYEPLKDFIATTIQELRENIDNIDN